MGVDDSGYISFAEWQGYVKCLEFDLIVPNWAIARLFDSIDKDGNRQIDWLAFERFFSGFATSSRVGFKPVFMGRHRERPNGGEELAFSQGVQDKTCCFKGGEVDIHVTNCGLPPLAPQGNSGTSSGTNPRHR